MLHQNSTVERIVIENGTATGVQTQDGFRSADVCILAAGCWSGQIRGLPDTVIPPVRPVKGQMLALRMREGTMLKNVIRTVKARYPMPVYLVPRTDGRLIVGATTEELGFDTDLTVGVYMNSSTGRVKLCRVFTIYHLSKHGQVYVPVAKIMLPYLVKHLLRI